MVEKESSGSPKTSTSLTAVSPRYDNEDGHLVCDVPGLSIPRNKGVFTLKQYVWSGSAI